MYGWQTVQVNFRIPLPYNVPRARINYLLAKSILVSVSTSLTRRYIGHVVFKFCRVNCLNNEPVAWRPRIRRTHSRGGHVLKNAFRMKSLKSQTSQQFNVKLHTKMTWRILQVFKDVSSFLSSFASSCSLSNPFSFSWKNRSEIIQENMQANNFLSVRFPRELTSLRNTRTVRHWTRKFSLILGQYQANFHLRK